MWLQQFTRHRHYPAGTCLAARTGVRLRFDRGTILFEGLQPEEILPDLPGVVWDGRVRAHRAPALLHPRLKHELGRRGISFVDAVMVDDEKPESWVPPEQRPYQDTALAAWELAGRRGILALPTGSGKTIVAIAAMARSGLRTLCLAPTRVLLSQWDRQIRRFYPGSVGCYGDGTRALGRITVATFESAWRHMDVLGNRFDLLVIDEVHHFGRGLRDEALEMCVAPARLGLTATPPADPHVLGRLSDLVGRPIFELSIGDLAGRYLAGFELVVLKLDLTSEERRDYEADLATFRPVFAEFRRVSGTPDWGAFVHAASRTTEGRRALFAWRRARRRLAFHRSKAETVAVSLQRHRGSRVLVFTADNETAYAIARAHLVMPITCDIGRAERSEALGRFERGELHALVSARVLNEGLDVPAADVAIIVAGSQGEREYVQRIGRCLRPEAGKRAIVYELVTRATAETAQSRRRRLALVSRTAASIPRS